MTRRVVTAMAVLLITAPMSCAQDLDGKVLLRYKWNVGEEVSLKMAVEAEGAMVMTDMTKEPPEEKAMYISQTINMP
ncbi:unnamed protein product, partial [marine sediment metagenome]